MVGGGFSWGGLAHKAEGIVHTAIHNIESHDWKQVGNDALNGAKIGAASGGLSGYSQAIPARARLMAAPSAPWRARTMRWPVRTVGSDGVTAQLLR
jgi:hypothetical protein